VSSGKWHRVSSDSPRAALLPISAPDAMRTVAIIYNEELYRAWGDLLYTIQTGQQAFAHQFGIPPLEHFAQHPDVDRVVNEAMIGYTYQVAHAAASAYDFSPFHTLVDVGGGYGTLLVAILERNPTAHGILFDQPHAASGWACTCSRSPAGVNEPQPKTTACSTRL
jgi:hypothetical protein